MALFTIQCITCQARLKVTDRAAIGNILACPKCGSMVQVAPPAGWEDAAPPDVPDPSSMADTVDDSQVWASESLAGAGYGLASSATSAASGTGLLGDPLGDGAAPPGSRTSSPRMVPPPVPPAVPPQVPEEVPASAADLPPMPGAAWVSPLERTLHRRIYLAAGAAAAMVAIAGLIAFLATRDDGPAADPQQQADVDETPGKTEASPDDPQPDPPAGVDPAPTPPGVPAKDPAPPDGGTPKDPGVDPTPPAVAPSPQEKQPPPIAKTTPPPPEPKELPGPGRKTIHDAEPKLPAQPAPDDVADELPEEIDTARAVEIEERLKMPVGELAFSRVALADFVAEISRMIGVPITLDPEALSLDRVDHRTMLSVQARDTTVGEALQRAIGRLEPVIEGSGLLITHPLLRSDEMRQVRHDVADLTGGDAAAANELAQLVRQMVEPDSWQAAGGKATLQTEAGALVVSHHNRAHWRILVLREKLRVARGLPTRSGYNPRQFALETPRSRMAALLARQTTINFDGAPLGEIVAYVNRDAQIHVLVDWRALARARIGPSTSLTMRATQATWADALDSLTANPRWTYQIVDERTVRLTTYAALDRNPAVRFYRVEALLSQGIAAEDLPVRVRELLSGDGGRKPAAESGWHVDSASRTLIVRAPDDIQDRVESALARLADHTGGQ